MIGKTLNHYKVVDRLGKGGMGEVWLAEDQKLHRRVALKLLPPEMAADPERRSRFENEARAVAALNHPNIVTIYSVEQAGDVHFLTMERVEGQRLTDLIPAEGLPLDELFRIAIPLADALATAHARGITHRDLKPDNVMLTPEGRVKVLDFGLAKLTDAGPLGIATGGQLAATVTAEGRILGTVAHMSPEQAEGKNVDVRSDVFSLGILLYEMATGRRPFEGDTPVSTISSILKEQPTSVTDLKHSLPRHLGRIVQRCLQKDRDRRYPSAKELRNELEDLRQEIDSGEMQAPAGVEEPPSARATQRRSRATWMVYALAAAGMLIGAAVVLVPLLTNGGESAAPVGPAGEAAVVSDSSIAVLPFTTVGDDAEGRALTDGIHTDLLTQLSKIDALRVISRTSVLEYAGTTRNLRQIAGELGVANVVEGSVQRAGDRVRINVQLIDAASDEHLWAETFDRELTARNIFEIQGEIAGEIATALQTTLSPEEQADLGEIPTSSLEAWELYRRGKDLFQQTDDDKVRIDQAVATFEKAVELDPEFAEAWADLGNTHSFAYHLHYDRTPERLERAREAIDRALALDPDLPEGRSALGHYHYWGFLEYDEALREFEIARRARPNYSDAIAGIASVERRQGKMESALENFRADLALDPRSYQAHAAVAETLILLRRYEEADEHYVRMLDLYPDVPTAYTRRAVLWMQWKADADRAMELLDRASELFPESGYVRQTRVSVLIDARRFEQALEELEAFPAGSAVQDDQFFYRSKELTLGIIHRALGDDERARESFEAARRALEQRMGESPEDVRLYGALGLALAGLGRKDEAIRQGRRGVEMLPVEKEAWRGEGRVRELAQIHAWVGNTDRARELIDELMSRPGDLSEAMLRTQPVWDPLH